MGETDFPERRFTYRPPAWSVLIALFLWLLTVLYFQGLDDPDFSGFNRDVSWLEHALLVLFLAVISALLTYVAVSAMVSTRQIILGPNSIFIPFKWSLGTHHRWDTELKFATITSIKERHGKGGTYLIIRTSDKKAHVYRTYCKSRESYQTIFNCLKARVGAAKAA